MKRFRTQAGDSKVGCVLWLAALAVGALICFKTIPVKIASSELLDFMDEQAKFSANSAPEVIKQRILTRANQLELPVKPQAVSVERLGDRIRMRVQFTFPVEFPGYLHNWDFDLKVDKPIFIF